MDIKQGLNLLFDYYSENDIYNPENDYKKLNFNLLKQSADDKLPQDWEIKIVLQGALNDMAKEEFVRLVEIGENKKKESNYVIVSSLKENGCNVALSKPTCQNISQVVNSMLPFMSLELAEQKSDPKDICEGDIIILLEVVNTLGKQLQSKITESIKPIIPPTVEN